jgi:hypothetical protein
MINVPSSVVISGLVGVIGVKGATGVTGSFKIKVESELNAEVASAESST